MESTLNSFPKTQASMEKIYKMISCVKCGDLPKVKVYMLGTCEHKYCEDCVSTVAGNSCVTCGALSIAKDATPDLFASTFLAGMKSLEKALNAEVLKKEKDSLSRSSAISSDQKDKPKGKKNSNNSSEVTNLKTPRNTTTKTITEKEDISKVDSSKADKVETSTRKKVGKIANKHSKVIESDEESLLSLNSIMGTPIRPGSKGPSLVDVDKTTNVDKTTGNHDSEDDVDSSENEDFQKPQPKRSAKKKQDIGKKTTSTKSEIRPDKKTSKSKSKSNPNNSSKNVTKGSLSDSDIDLFDDDIPKSENDEEDPPSLTPYPKAQKLRKGQDKKGENAKGKKRKINTKEMKDDENCAADELGFTSDEKGKSPPPALTPYGKAEKVTAKKDDEPVSVARRSKRVASVITEDAPKQKRKFESPKLKTATTKDDKKSLTVLLHPLKLSNSKSATTKEKSMTPTPTDNVTPAKIVRGNRSQKSSTSSSVASGNANRSLSSPAVDKRNPKGETPLHVACRAGHVEKAKLLISEGADINAQDHAGWTPLHEAINGSGTGRLAVVKMLCEEGCNTNIPGMDNESALHEAARNGLLEIVKILLAHSASPNVRNKLGKLPRNVAEKENIKKVLDEAAGINSDADILNSPAIEDDPVVLEIQFSKALLYINYDVSPETLKSVEKELKLKVSKDLRPEVTHILFSEEKESRGKVAVDFSFGYLFGITEGAWMLRSKWLEDSISAKKLLPPKSYEIKGCVGLDGDDAPANARVNKEIGNPGLFHGMSFYLYKNCSYRNISKKELAKLITNADGSIINREPQPDSVDPLEAPVRFHAKDNNHKLVLTSHVVLYDEKNEPPKDKKHNMEHIKVLKIDWLIDSIGKFTLLDPTKYL